MNPATRFTFYAASGLLCLLSATSAHAVPIQYTFTTTGTGSLGGQSFSGPFTIRAFANTDDVVENPPTPFAGVFRVVNSSATVELPGFPTAMFSIPTWSVSNTAAPAVGFSAPLVDLRHTRRLHPLGRRIQTHNRV